MDKWPPVEGGHFHGICLVTIIALHQGLFVAASASYWLAHPKGHYPK